MPQAPANTDTPIVYGLNVTGLTQCDHYSTPRDIIAIKHACCRKFYACISCHNALEPHEPKTWPRNDRSEKAVLCGGCKHELRIDEYMRCKSMCTKCGADFNPGCKGHWSLYFDLSGESIL